MSQGESKVKGAGGGDRLTEKDTTAEEREAERDKGVEESEGARLTADL